MIAEWIQECDLMTASRRIVQRERHAPDKQQKQQQRQLLKNKLWLPYTSSLFALSRNALLLLRCKCSLYLVHSLSRNTNHILERLSIVWKDRNTRKEVKLAKKGELET